MTIIFTNRLSNQQMSDAMQLIKKCQTYDKTYRTPYLSNMLNFDHDMPCFFLKYHQDSLIGLLTVYADAPEVEVTINIAPDHRQQGHARALFDTFIDKTKDFQLEKWSFMTEKVFLDKHPNLIDHWHLTVDDDESEIWLGRNRETFSATSSPTGKVRLARLDDIEQIANLQVEAFEEPFDISQQYAKEATKDDRSLLYLLENQGNILASCTVDLSTDVNYLYGLAVLPNHQRQGLGSTLVKHIINELVSQNPKTFQIAVDKDNVGARRLYERLGFTYQTEVIYLNTKA